MAAIGRLCCKSLFALLIANFLSCRRGFRVSMWGTSSPGDQLTGDSVTRLTPHLSAIVACFDFWREICHPAFSDFCNTICHVWTAPSWQELSSRLQHWSVQPCVRPLDAVHMTAGHNA